jgi:hypothetical protein
VVPSPPPARSSASTRSATPRSCPTLTWVSWALKGLLAGFLLLGICGLTVGYLGDTRGWWEDFGFVSNVLAGATGASFGIPFAVLVLQRLIRESEERAAQARLRRRIGQELRDIERHLDVDGAALLRLGQYSRTSRALADLRGVLQRTLESDGPGPASSPEELERLVEQLIADLAPEVDRALEDPSGSVTDGAGRAARIRLARNRWRVVLEELLPQLDGHVIEPITDDIHTVSNYLERAFDERHRREVDPVVPAVGLAEAMRELRRHRTLRPIRREEAIDPRQLSGVVEQVSLSLGQLRDLRSSGAFYEHDQCRTALRAINAAIDPGSEHVPGRWVLD